MQGKCLTLLFFVSIGLCQIAAAQATSVQQPERILSLNQELKELTNNDWTLYADEENKLYYIDFESLRVNVSDVVVKNRAGEVLYRDNVFSLPVNTIYELDFSKYKAGQYEIELRTFTGVIRKSVQVKS
ncbi:MAG TPA: hypothetical protein PKD70_04915 [Saprospiraceae bacterium]|nr:hypothetical protein [Saprospiraceae bacterium]HMP13199.1 hypothetical protein [Saprospiraceae bacterium]